MRTKSIGKDMARLKVLEQQIHGVTFPLFDNWHSPDDTVIFEAASTLFDLSLSLREVVQHLVTATQPGSEEQDE